MNFPNQVNLKDITLSVYDPNFYSESKSLKGHARGIPGSRFECTFKTVALNPATARDVWGFINALRGQLNPFTLVLPTYSSTYGTIATNPTSKAAVAAGVQSFIINLLPLNVAGLLVRGDAVKFAGHSKVYTVVESVTSNGQGEAVMQFEPRLQQAVAANELVIVHDVPFRWRLRSDKSAFSKKVGDQGYYSFSFDCVEAI